MNHKILNILLGIVLIVGAIILIYFTFSRQHSLANGTKTTGQIILAIPQGNLTALTIRFYPPNQSRTFIAQIPNNIPGFIPGYSIPIIYNPNNLLQVQIDGPLISGAHYTGFVIAGIFTFLVGALFLYSGFTKRNVQN